MSSRAPNAKPWVAERELSPESALALIAEQFPDLAGRPIELYGTGWDNTVFKVCGQLVFRFPRRELAVSLIQVEAKLLPQIANELPLPIPVPLYFGEPSESFPWPFVGYAEVRGTTADRARLDASARTQCAVPLAEFLRTLHALAVPTDAPPDRIRRLDLNYRLEQVEGRLKDVCALGLIPDPAPYEAVLAATPLDWTPRSNQLVHGDLYARHVLVDASARACGIIDWGDVHHGDAAIDLGLAHGFLPPAAHAAFRAAYGPIDDPTWRVARFKALHHTLAIASYAHDIDDLPLAAEGNASLAHLASPE